MREVAKPLHESVRVALGKRVQPQNLTGFGVRDHADDRFHALPFTRTRVSSARASRTGDFAKTNWAGAWRILKILILTKWLPLQTRQWVWEFAIPFSPGWRC